MMSVFHTGKFQTLCEINWHFWSWVPNDSSGCLKHETSATTTRSLVVTSGILWYKTHSGLRHTFSFGGKNPFGSARSPREI